MTDERLRLSPVSGGEAKTAFGGCDKSATDVDQREHVGARPEARDRIGVEPVVV
eukprot:CAMPEP_0180079302 /NCGR_PEP_ID=MMETSP0985-20121206/16820_1 /TAXON_ID=483367 /ORGANISM="non described non described, Strain CCMP 2436" /LENGTH=53 /DNA_ID=CAMNT_0022012017 /DNA_START=134 /DNA_END=294 /DNA_ORIENTATION=+